MCSYCSRSLGTVGGSVGEVGELVGAAGGSGGTAGGFACAVVRSVGDEGLADAAGSSSGESVGPEGEAGLTGGSKVQQEVQQVNIANTSGLQPDGLAKAKEERGMSSAMKMYLQVQRFTCS